MISVSEIRDFLRCRYKWWLRSQLRLEPLVRPVPFAFGTVMHNGWERWYGRWPRPPMKTLLKKTLRADQLVESDRELVVAMLLGYERWAVLEDREIGLEEANAEQEFDLPLLDGRVRLRGKRDVTFKPVTLKKTMDCMEFKTPAQFRDTYVETTLQLSAYLWSMWKEHPKLRRFRAHFTQARKQLPGPRVKADLFKRDTVERSEEELRQWEVDTYNIAFDMLDAAIYPSPMDSCQWECDMQGPCLQRGNPEDLKHILTTQFKPKEYRR